MGSRKPRSAARGVIGCSQPVGDAEIAGRGVRSRPCCPGSVDCKLTTIDRRLAQRHCPSASSDRWQRHSRVVTGGRRRSPDAQTVVCHVRQLHESVSQLGCCVPPPSSNASIALPTDDITHPPSPSSLSSPSRPSRRGGAELTTHFRFGSAHGLTRANGRPPRPVCGGVLYMYLYNAINSGAKAARPHDLRTNTTVDQPRSC